jgi:hypothetical protein
MDCRAGMIAVPYRGPCANAASVDGFTFWRPQSSSRWSSGLIAEPMTPLILKRASARRPSGQWARRRLRRGRERRRRPHLLARRYRTARPSLDVGERALGGHDQARTARLRADARSSDAGVRKELATASSGRAIRRPTGQCDRHHRIGHSHGTGLG